MKIEVSNIKALTTEQCEALKPGDIVVKITGNDKHSYRVSYKGQTGLCLTYSDCENVETVAYEKENGAWAWDSTDVTAIGTALHSADFDEVTENELTAAWQAAMTAAETPANNNEQSGD